MVDFKSKQSSHKGCPTVTEGQQKGSEEDATDCMSGFRASGSLRSFLFLKLFGNDVSLYASLGMLLRALESSDSGV